MTLFKKVFGGHAVGDQSDPAWPAQNDGFQFDDSFDDEIAARVASAANSKVPDAPAIEDQAEAADDAGARPADEPAEDTVDDAVAGIVAQAAPVSSAAFWTLACMSALRPSQMPLLTMT